MFLVPLMSFPTAWQRNIVPRLCMYNKLSYLCLHLICFPVLPGLLFVFCAALLVGLPWLFGRRAHERLQRRITEGRKEGASCRRAALDGAGFCPSERTWRDIPGVPYRLAELDATSGPKYIFFVRGAVLAWFQERHPIVVSCLLS